MLVTGEAGVGKSRLLREVESYARQAGAAVLPGRALPGSEPLRPLSEALLRAWRGRPFPDAAGLRPFRTALARLVPGWAVDSGTPGGADAGSPVVLGEAVLELLVATGPAAGTVVTLEDLHWADPATVAVLEHLATSAATSPVLVVGTARSDEPGSVLTVTGDAVRGGLVGARVVALHRLPPEVAASVASDAAGGRVLPVDVVDFVVERADGLPLLVEEVLTGLVESGALSTGGVWERTGDLTAAVPAGLRHIVETRLARLDPPQRAVLDAVAVGGADLPWRLVAVATGFDEPVVLGALRAGVDANLLTATEPAGGVLAQTGAAGSAGSGLGWRHDLTRQAVLHLMLPPERQRVAGALADALAADGGLTDGGPTDPTGSLDAGRLLQLADLRVAAGQGAAAADALRAAARRALRRGEPAAAEALLRRAADLDPSAPVTADLVTALALTGRAVEALDIGSAVLASTSGEEHARLCLELARAAVTADRWADALAFVERSGLAGAPEADAVAADAAFGSGDVERAERLARAVVADAAATPAEVCEALEVLGRVARISDLATAEEHFRRGAQVAAGAGLVAARVRGLHSLATLELARQGTSAALVEARSVAEDAGMLATVAGIDLLLGEVATVADGPRDGIAAATRARDLAARLRLDEMAAAATLLLAMAHALGEDRAAADAELARVAPMAALVPDIAALARMARAMTPLLAADLESARDELDAAVDGIGCQPGRCAGELAGDSGCCCGRCWTTGRPQPVTCSPGRTPCWPGPTGRVCAMPRRWLRAAPATPRVRCA